MGYIDNEEMSLRIVEDSPKKIMKELYKDWGVMNETDFVPVSSGTLEKWIDGNRIFMKEEECPAFGPRLQPYTHFTFDINAFESYFGDCGGVLGKWDCFQNSDDPEEMRYNTITRLVIVIFILLVVVGVREWLTSLIVGALLIVVLWFTTISTGYGGIDSVKPKHRRSV